ncbi:MAG: hypothetical protein ACKOCU_07720, partial [Betaproteobacteria bacterium]
GREEAEALLERRSGQEDNPRILEAFNEETPDWLSFFMFTYFTDRDGKFQLCALAESAFDPLARTTKFMLTEEAHHMFVGESGVGRVITRTCQAMNELKTDDPKKLREAGVIDLPTIQRYLNFHFSVTIDLFGADESSNAATFYSTGLKGRYEEGKRTDDHQLRGQTYRVLEVKNGQLAEKEVPMLNALNEVLRDDYIKDSIAGVERWNKIIEKAGIPFRLKAPHKAFHRNIGALAESGFDPLARTTKFMLTEEAHHMFVGESGVSRVIARTCQVMNELKTDDPAKIRAAGVIDLPTIQRYLNFHFSVTIDLFGADESSNAAIFYNSGLKGRYEETKRGD